jgi:phosphate transport system permease protein
MRLAGSGSMLYLVWSDGRLQRFDTRSLDAMQLAESVDALEESAAVVTRVGMAIGKTSLLVGDSTGRVGIWFPIRPQGGTDTSDAAELVRGKVLEPGAGASAVTAIAPSARSRLVAVGYEDGSARLFFATSAASLGDVDAPRAEPIVALAFAPKEDALLASTPTGAWSAAFDARHPEASFRGIFRPVWYEGYEKPEHAWQSSSGTDDFEPKLGMMPLVFGTLKATVYSMLFGVPLALLAAIYSSEFLSPRVRVPVKSTIEMMASLPSVVLGFLAAMILAPFVQSVVPAVFAALLTVPMSLLLGAYLWQLLPAAVALRRQSLRILAVGACIPIGVLAAFLLGPVVESLLFAGDIMSWLDGQVGGPFGGWFVLLLPLVALLVALMAGRVVQPWLRGLSTQWDRNKCARADLIKFLAASAVVAVLTSILAFAIGAAGFDPRNSVLGTYEQRNALVVGFVMGFAIVPIIYTLAEDALSSVPRTLKEGSLGSGATPWQTAWRITIPTAMSGLFSALMVGLGRAVGETMIVLMATGNTPILDWNLGSGFRTLAANIAVELPEAPRDTTHFRTLFLAAFLLFLMTFAINTVAELVRRTFRKRAAQL